jgi:hypothetical protein
MRRLFIALAVAGCFLAAVPIAQADSADTTTTFSITAGALTISAPASQSLGSVGAGATQVGPTTWSSPVTVTDNRGDADAAWSLQATTTDFEGGSGTSVPKANVLYRVAAAGRSTSGTGCLYSYQDSFDSMGSAGTSAASASACVGANSASWFPEVEVNLSGTTTVAGPYTATVTHAVS